MKEYTTILVSRGAKKKLFNIKCDLKMRSFEEAINALLKIKDISFLLEREGHRREVSGVPLYDKLKDGWKIVSYKLKKEDEQLDQV